MTAYRSADIVAVKINGQRFCPSFASVGTTGPTVAEAIARLESENDAMATRNVKLEAELERVRYDRDLLRDALEIQREKNNWLRGDLQTAERKLEDSREMELAVDRDLAALEIRIASMRRGLGAK